MHPKPYFQFQFQPGLVTRQLEYLQSETHLSEREVSKSFLKTMITAGDWYTIPQLPQLPQLL